ncbi:MAG: electron transfer flavoprotein subunit alpha/FixB family protein [Flavobacteriales bacterium]|nr:electron transfer flavoprotein subunit alpha/FixB family protein [Flavobacteriales bacterium]
MSVLVYTESWGGSFRKSTFEAVSYASEIAKALGTEVVAVSLENVSDEELNKLSNYGVSKVISVENINKGDSQASSKIISDLSSDSNVVVFSNTHTAKMIAPRLSVKINASCITNVISLTSSSEITVNRKSFSTKAIETVKSNAEKTILCIAPNSYGVIVNNVSMSIEKSDFSESGSLTFEGQETSSGKISISEAEIVVSGGRGLKGPENWGMIEELAEVLGAATACSKPVADIGWRPHAEHVGQTGKVVASDLYIAIGISGAIQHLAGVNSSKVMVAINTDPEAPFFKAADYGIVGDAFEVVPKLIEEIKKIKN